jgi:hypothetical protein
VGEVISKEPTSADVLMMPVCRDPIMNLNLICLAMRSSRVHGGMMAVQYFPDLSKTVINGGMD